MGIAKNIFEEEKGCNLGLYIGEELEEIKEKLEEEKKEKEFLKAEIEILKEVIEKMKYQMLMSQLRD